MKNVITIDGPSGAGKSTVAKKLAEKLNYKYLDTGAMYRAVTYKVLKENINLNNYEKIIDLAQKLNIDFLPSNKKGNKPILVNNKDITDKIRKPEIDKNVSQIAKIKGVRKVLVKKQRNIAENQRIILDGRDTGTRVIPEAEYKFYITATLEERARRRFQEQKNKNITFQEVKNDIKKRDKIDKNREYSPLKKAEDAIYVDTTNLNIQEVTQKLFDFVKNKNSNHKNNSKSRKKKE